MMIWVLQVNCRVKSDTVSIRVKPGFLLSMFYRQRCGRIGLLNVGLHALDVSLLLQVAKIWHRILRTVHIVFSTFSKLTGIHFL